MIKSVLNNAFLAKNKKCKKENESLKAKRTLLSFVAVATISQSTFTVAEAHPGRTDANGGHYCRTNCEQWGLGYGEYHYHNGGGGSSSSSSSSSSVSTSNYQAQQAEAERQRQAEAQRQAEEAERQRIAQEQAQNEASKKEGHDNGYSIGKDQGYNQKTYDDSTGNTNAYYIEGYKEGYKTGYDEGKLQREEEKKKEAMLLEVYNLAKSDGERAFKDGKKNDEYNQDAYASYDDEQKAKYEEGFAKGWNNAKKVQVKQQQAVKAQQAKEAEQKAEEDEAERDGLVVGGLATASIPIAYLLWRRNRKNKEK